MAQWLLALIPLLETLLQGSDAALILSILRSLFAAKSVTAALGAVTFAQWLQIGGRLLAAAPEVRQFLAAVHPALAQFDADLKSKSVHEAAANIRAVFMAAKIKTVPGYQADGSVGSIPNPDAKEN